MTTPKTDTMTDQQLLARNPCATCPYRRDVPSGIWAAEEYDKLRRYDAETALQPMALFMCHQRDQRVCAGWAACHDGDELLALRIAVMHGTLTLEQAEAIRDYTTTTPTFASGNEAADHGTVDINNPNPRAVAAIRKIETARVRCP